MPISGEKDILTMKYDIKSQRHEPWANFETVCVGVYASQCANKDVFVKCLLDVKAYLKEYLKKESKKIDLYRISSLSNFLNPG